MNDTPCRECGCSGSHAMGCAFRPIYVWPDQADKMREILANGAQTRALIDIYPYVLYRGGRGSSSRSRGIFHIDQVSRSAPLNQTQMRLLVVTAARSPSKTERRRARQVLITSLVGGDGQTPATAKKLTDQLISEARQEGKRPASLAPGND